MDLYLPYSYNIQFFLLAYTVMQTNMTVCIVRNAQLIQCISGIIQLYSTNPIHVSANIPNNAGYVR